MSSRKVLVVDDDESIREVLTYNLEEMGIDVLAATSAEEGWRVYAEEKPEVVITDVRMTGMSGMDLLDRIREVDPGGLVIVITAFGSVRQAVEAMKRGAHDYLTKPFDRDALKLTVRRALKYAEVRRENVRLREQLGERFGLTSIVGRSAAMQDLFRVIARVAPTDATVLIEGETGTGKELFARAVHHASQRASRNFVTVNCTAIPRELLESELFGHVKGAFTGATAHKTGKFELADGGTIFLDEIGDIDQDLQKKLLRVLQEREIDKVGAGASLPVDARVVAATNQPLLRLVEEGRFRKDLYYRLSVVPVHVPPLRERREDILLLAEHFLRRLGGREVTLSIEASALLEEHEWPGNVRELENTIERLLILRRREETIDAEDVRSCGLPHTGATDAPPGETSGGLPGGIPAEGLVLDDVEKHLIEEALRKTGGNQSAAARMLGITRQTLIYRMQKHGLRPGGAD